MSERQSTPPRGVEDNSAEMKVGASAVEAIARRVVELLEHRGDLAREPRYVDAATLAQELSVERDWVYAHARQLGAIRLGGPRGRLRFDRRVVAERLAGAETERAPRRKKVGALESLRPGHHVPLGGSVKSPQRRQRASGRTPARSPKQHHPGGSPE